ncbi:hypothetical protein L1887_62569 [Cichorium endivia]|nr:hypothetical protein L1887_62569 [Cichorium endivia]
MICLQKTKTVLELVAGANRNRCFCRRPFPRSTIDEWYHAVCLTHCVLSCGPHGLSGELSKNRPNESQRTRAALFNTCKLQLTILAGSPESTHLDNTQLHNSLSSNDLLREQSTKRELISAPKAFSGRTVFDRLQRLIV